MNNNTTSISDKYLTRHKIDFPTLSMWLIIGMSFVLHFFAIVFSGYIFAILTATFTVLYCFSKRYITLKIDGFVMIWLCALAIVVISFMRSQRTNGAFLDVIIFSCGFMLILASSSNNNVYLRGISFVRIISIVFATGILLQSFFPSVYRISLNIFPATYRQVLLINGSGFTTNSGFSAGYIIAGLLASFSSYKDNTKSKFKNNAVIVFLIIALLMTGKRGPIIFTILTLIYVYLAPLRGTQKFKRYWKLFLGISAVLLLLWLFRDLLSNIPGIGRVLKSVVDFMSGEDVSSGRLRLYMWAIDLFRRNPLLGIGWGNYRSTVVGNVTSITAFEAHNIYLQLLAETGVIGFLAFVSLFVSFWIKAYKAYCECVAQGSENGLKEWRQILFFSLAYQVYFLLYGLTGNPLYDQHFQILYIFACTGVVGFYRAYR